MLIEAGNVATTLLVSRERVYAMVRAGVFPKGVVIKLGARKILFDSERLTEWLEKGGTLQDDASTNKKGTNNYEL